MKTLIVAMLMVSLIGCGADRNSATAEQIPPMHPGRVVRHKLSHALAIIVARRTVNDVEVIDVITNPSGTSRVQESWWLSEAEEND